MDCYEIEVYGKVQGVGYRWYAKKVAGELGILGWVKNNYDGIVKIMAQGDTLQINTVIDYLKIGPPMARVTDVTICKTNCLKAFDEFGIMR